MSDRSPPLPRRPSLAVVAAVALAGCTGERRRRRSWPTRPRPGRRSRRRPRRPVAAADPLPVVLPRDDGPHDRLTEWWYYTGHLRADDGARYGFEYVIFRAERGAFPTSWASHLAITDETGERFVYAQRLEVGPQVDGSPRGADGEPTGFDLSLSGADPSRPETFGRPAWTMTGGDGARPPGRDARARRGGRGRDAGRDGPRPRRCAATKPPALHDRDGWIDFGPAGGSYYYSRTAHGRRRAR